MKTKKITKLQSFIIIAISLTTLIVNTIMVFSETADLYCKIAFLVITLVLTFESITDIVSYSIYVTPIYVAVIALMILAVVKDQNPAEVFNVLTLPIILCAVLAFAQWLNADKYIGEGDMFLVALLAFNTFDYKCLLYAISLAITIVALVIRMKLIDKQHLSGNGDESDEIEDKKTKPEYPLAPFFYIGYLLITLI